MHVCPEPSEVIVTWVGLLLINLLVLFYQTSLVPGAQRQAVPTLRALHPRPTTTTTTRPGTV